MMRRALSIVGLLSVAACGTLAGHALTYLMEGRTSEDGHHGYFSPSVEIAVAAALLSFVVLAGRSLFGYGRLTEITSLPRLSVALSLLQVGGFIALELSEGNAPSAVGGIIEMLVALLCATIVSLVFSLVERCAEALHAAYVPRLEVANAFARPLLTDAAAPSILLAACAGVRRFKRPPPALG